MNLRAMPDIQPYEGPEDARPVQFDTISVDNLWKLRETIIGEQRELSSERGAIEAELQRRVEAAHPDFTAEAGGTAQLAGEELIVKMGYTRDYAVNADILDSLEGSTLLTDAEFKELVKYEPRVNGTVFNSLTKRGGKLAELLAHVRFLKSARPTFEATERK